MHNWIPLVLEDIRLHAAQTGLKALAAQLSMSIAVARADIALAEDRPSANQPAPTGTSEAERSALAAILPFCRPSAPADDRTAMDPRTRSRTDTAGD
jgi:hypothetical protein